ARRDRGETGGRDGELFTPPLHPVPDSSLSNRFFQGVRGVAFFAPSLLEFFRRLATLWITRALAGGRAVFDAIPKKARRLRSWHAFDSTGSFPPSSALV